MDLNDFNEDANNFNIDLTALARLPPPTVATTIKEVCFVALVVSVMWIHSASVSNSPRGLVGPKIRRDHHSFVNFDAQTLRYECQIHAKNMKITSIECGELSYMYDYNPEHFKNDPTINFGITEEFWEDQLSQVRIKWPGTKAWTTEKVVIKHTEDVCTNATAARFQQIPEIHPQTFRCSKAFIDGIEPEKIHVNRFHLYITGSNRLYTLHREWTRTVYKGH